jgi:hypothetical protein
VAGSPRPAHVILTGSPDNANVDEQLMRAAGYRSAQVDGFTIWYRPSPGSP